VLVGGTNGKGSTAAFTEALLRASGLRVGLFTSPHLNSFRERIRVDGHDLEAAEVVTLAHRVLRAAEGIGYDATFFECTWAMAALAFDDAKVDCVVWEVGLGGRLDATNVCTPVASAVVTVDLDHEDILGAGFDAIAREKAALFRAGRPALTAARGPGLAALRRWIDALPGSERPTLRVCREDFAPYGGALPLPGEHQSANAAVALELATALGIRPRPEDLASVRWPGRGERLPNGTWVDCAHNVEGARAVVEWLEAAQLGAVELVFGAMQDKDFLGVLSILAPAVARIVVVTPDHPRGAPATEVVRRFEESREGTARGKEVVAAGGVQAALEAPLSGGKTVRLVTGSCYLVGEARAHVLRQPWPECGLATRAR
jgi:dihydrofolate synthase/folylpolyglutamate synthase